MEATSSASTVTKMPAVTSTTTEEQNDPDQRMWNALKWHISRERQRKKQGKRKLFVVIVNSVPFETHLLLML